MNPHWTREWGGAGGEEGANGSLWGAEGGEVVEERAGKEGGCQIGERSDLWLDCDIWTPS